ncbi:RidA family protein [Saccharopolyspora pogona]|uniref:RidA family protein n=1 Tax=Saccharopolyspora pogona TaxID=333966 RepID=UPI001CC23C79|nr:RidA family protein [Saccharopolyspora pogona]
MHPAEGRAHLQPDAGRDAFGEPGGRQRPEPVAEFLAEPYPADTLLEVSSLAQPDWQLEIDAIALAR